MTTKRIKTLQVSFYTLFEIGKVLQKVKVFINVTLDNFQCLAKKQNSVLMMLLLLSIKMLPLLSSIIIFFSVGKLKYAIDLKGLISIDCKGWRIEIAEKLIKAIITIKKMN